jgi:hypothetical protein
LYGMSEYLMIMHELEKVRLADLARKDNQAESISQVESPLVRASAPTNRTLRR